MTGGTVKSIVWKAAGYTMTKRRTQVSAIPSERTAIRVQDEKGRYVFGPAEPIKEPTIVELAQNFGTALEKWTAAGWPTLTQEQYDIRAAACGSCELWDGSARFGLGKCNAPGCGCTKLKRWLTTEVCKHPAGSRWPSLEVA